MNQPHPIAGIILSGGASRRMGTPKALLKYREETFLDRMIRLFVGNCTPLIVVLGHQADQIRTGIQRADQALFVTNPDPGRGMLSSLQCGLRMVPGDANAAMFTPVDHPNLEGSTLELLIGAFQARRAVVTLPTYAGAHGHPVCIARELIPQLLDLPPTAQASDVIHRYVSETCYVAVADAAVTKDIDDPASYAELIGRPSV